MGYRPPYEGFEDIGFGMNPRSSFPTQILTLFLLVVGILHFTNWLHANYIGNTKDLILSLRSFEIHPKLAKKCTNSYVDFVLLETY